nr:hypothetical protein HmN_000895500 [Hymenolepis microstoma]
MHWEVKVSTRAYYPKVCTPSYVGDFGNLCSGYGEDEVIFFSFVEVLVGKDLESKLHKRLIVQSATGVWPAESRRRLVDYSVNDHAILRVKALQRVPPTPPPT